MLDSVTKKRIDDLRNILVGKIPSPQSQVEQITTGLIYKFMYDMDNEAIEMGGVPSFFVDEYEKYSWKNLFNTKLGGVEKVKLYSDAIENLYTNPNAPSIFREIFKNSFLPFKDPSTLNMFLKEINEFHYSNSEQLGDAYEYLLSFMGSQGDAGQFRTPRHIIDFIIQIVNPQKNETILDPACGTSGFLISSYKHILNQNTQTRIGDKLNASERKQIGDNLVGYDIDPAMSRISLVNMYLHNFASPNISEYDTLSSEDKWNEYFDVILANPPFFSPTGGIKPHSRFSVKSTRAEVLFVDYIVDHLKPNGRAGIIVPEGIIFQKGNAHKILRKKLVKDCLIGVISLPAGVFQPYSGVKTSILILDKNFSKNSDQIFFADVGNDGFSLSVQRTPINENDLPTLLSKINKRNFKGDYVNKIPKTKILESLDFTLTVSDYIEKEVFVSNFPIVKLGQVADFQNGFAFKSSDWSYTGKPIIRIQNLTNSSNNINKTKVRVDSKYEVEKGDLLISWSATIGVFIWDGPSALLNQHIFLVKPKKEILKKYLYFLGLKIKERIQDKVHGNTMTHITKEKFLDIEIPLPSLEIQQKLVDELDNYQQIIDGCKKVIKNYKPIININKSWDLIKLGELFDFQNGYAFKSSEFSNSGIQLIRMGNIKKGYFDINNKVIFLPYEFEEKYRKFILSENDLIISMTGTTGKKDYGNVCKISSGKFFLNQRVGKFIKKSNIIHEQFFYYLTQTEFFRSRLFAKSSGGVRQANISGEAIKSIEIPIPDFLTQSKIAENIDNEVKIIKGNEKLINLTEIKIREKLNNIWGN